MHRRRRRTLSSSTIPSHQTVKFVSGAHRDARNELRWFWEWVEDNLGVRAATAVAKMVEKGRVVGLEDLSGRLVRGGKAWGA